MEALEKRVGELPASVRKYDRSLRAIRTREWKLIRGSDGSKRLFNVTDDPDERHGRAEEHPEKVAELESKLDDWLDSFEHATDQSDVEMDPETKERLEDLGYIQ
jgi:arylsulfatase A-like enzyme